MLRCPLRGPGGFGVSLRSIDRSPRCGCAGVASVCWLQVQVAALARFNVAVRRLGLGLAWIGRGCGYQAFEFAICCAVAAD